MKKLLKVVTAPFRAIGVLPSKKSKLSLPAPTPVATRDEARDRIVTSRGFLRRRGGTADILFGGGGIEPGAAPSLGVPGSF